MNIISKDFEVKGLTYKIRTAHLEDANALSLIRLQIDGETENMDRERGEAFIDALGFEKLIESDNNSARNLFLVAEAFNKIVGFSRCQGSELRRSMHKVEFGVCILSEYWHYGMGTHLLEQSIAWANSIGIKKMILAVLETNKRAIELYMRHGFVQEGILKKDKLLADGSYYDTILMAKFMDA